MARYLYQTACEKCEDIGDEHSHGCIVRKVILSRGKKIIGNMAGPGEALENAIKAIAKFREMDDKRRMEIRSNIIPFEELKSRGKKMSLAVESKNQELVQSQSQQVPNMSNPFSSLSNFEAAQRMAKALSQSSLIPKEYQNNIPNCLIALEISQRLRASALMVMQNLYIVHGKPGWSAQYIISAINSCGKFSPLRFKMDPNNTECTAYAVELKTGETLHGTKITMAMAKAEKWVDKAGSKWQTMPEQMLRYRAASFFGKIYAPEILMGFQTTEEIEDMQNFEKAKEVKSSVEIYTKNDLEQMADEGLIEKKEEEVIVVEKEVKAELKPGDFGYEEKFEMVK